MVPGSSSSATAMVANKYVLDLICAVGIIGCRAIGAVCRCSEWLAMWFVSASSQALLKLLLIPRIRSLLLPL